MLCLAYLNWFNYAKNFRGKTLFELQLILDLSLVWLAAAIFGFAAVALKQPAMAGYMLAGLMIGPHGLKLISNSEQISLLAELNVALLQFALDLEMSFRQLLFRTKRVVASVNLCSWNDEQLSNWMTALAQT